MVFLLDCVEPGLRHLHWDRCARSALSFLHSVAAFFAHSTRSDPRCATGRVDVSQDHSIVKTHAETPRIRYSKEQTEKFDRRVAVRFNFSSSRNSTLGSVHGSLSLARLRDWLALCAIACRVIFSARLVQTDVRAACAHVRVPDTQRMRR
jgi:hypothetical protein